MLTTTQESSLAELRGKIRLYMSGKRLLHTYAVEEEISSLAKIYCPDEEYPLRVAALLHDITKEKNLSEQLALCEKYGIGYTDEEKLSPKIFHAKTGEAVARADFPEYAELEAISSIGWHTTGRRGMTLFDELLYLADWIEATRTFPLCKELRAYFYDGLKIARTAEDKEKLLLETMIKALDMTIIGLIEDGQIVHSHTLEARNGLAAERILKWQMR